MALSDNAIQALTAHVEKESREWAAQYIAQRRAVMDRRKIKATGGLIDSLRYQMTTTLRGAAFATLELSFDEHGRYVDMKRLNIPDGGAEVISNLAAWISKKNLFDKYVDRYMQKRGLVTRPSEATVLNNMAWAVLMSRKTKFKRKPWYAKSSQAAITDLFNRVAAGLPDIVLDELKKQFD